MADTTVLLGGNPVKLVDNGDGTFSLASKLATESTPDAAVPTKASFVAGKYVTADPEYTSGDLAPIRTNAKGEIIAQIAGSAAHDAAASGNPVQIGGVYRATDPALTDGDAGSLRVNAKGEALVQLTGSIITQNSIAQNITILSGATWVGAMYDSKMPNIGASIYIGSTARKGKLIMYGYDSTLAAYGLAVTIKDFSSSAVNATSGVTTVNATRFKIAVSNNDTVDWSFVNLDLFQYA